MVIQRLNRERHILHQMRVTIMKNLLDDPRTQQFFTMLAESERKKFNEFKQTSGQSSPSLGKQAVSKEDMALQIKRTALQQNQYFQQHPENIPLATQTVDSMVTEMATSRPSSKKIENKSSDNNHGDILTINIQRKNGDF
jgi:hypothetical protein